MTASQRSCAGKIQTEPNANDEGLQHGDEYLAELDHIEASWLLSIVSLSEVLKWSFRSSASLASTSASQTLVHGAYYGKTLVATVLRRLRCVRRDFPVRFSVFGACAGRGKSKRSLQRKRVERY